MRVPVALALRAELRRARSQTSLDPLALFVVGLGDDSDLPAWALACELAPERIRSSRADPAGALVVGAVSRSRLIATLHRAGERDLSAKLSSCDTSSVPVLLLRDVIRVVTVLHQVESQEAEAMLHQRPLGSA